MPNDSNVVDAALARIHHSWGSAKKDLVLAVKLDTIGNSNRGDGVPRGYRKLAKFTGLKERYVHRLLRELVAERVLIVAHAGAGSRGAVYEINLEVREWRVPWRVAGEIVETYAAIQSGALVVAETRFAPRWGAPQTDLVPRHAPAVNPLSARPQRGSEPTALPRWGAAVTDSLSHATPLSSIEDQSLDGTNGFATVCGAVAQRSGYAVGGTYAARLENAIADLDPEPIIDAILTAPEGLGLQMHVTRVEQLAALQRRNRTAETTARSSWAADPDCPQCGGSGMYDSAPGYAAQCPCRRPTSDTPL